MIPSQNACVLIIFLFHSSLAGAQSVATKSQQQLWLAYMTSTTINQNYSWWNDFHYVPQGFLVVRTGITRHLNKIAITSGYGFVLLPISSTHPQLQRTEHRPWCQAALTIPMQHAFTFTHRIRYDARFKQDVQSNQPTEHYSFSNRIRFLISIKKTFLTKKETKRKPFVAISDEILLNFSTQSLSPFDQNRIQISIGMQSHNIQYQLGYMNRLVQTGASERTENHTLTLWITQKFSLMKKNNNPSH